jgi:hypothetical protein
MGVDVNGTAVGLGRGVLVMVDVGVKVGSEVSATAVVGRTSFGAQPIRNINNRS